ncbi:MAG: phosphate ABC transporter permease PstA [Spirochaetales bacterium]|nr:phosphate ABC transporter permease PstA [Spirochaetales bacterium]
MHKKQSPFISGYTRQVKLKEKIMKGLIWIAAGVTIFILFWIFGYIIYKGLISDITREYNVAGKGSTIFPLDEKGENEVICIVHKGIRAGDLSMQVIRSFYNGDERYWLVSEQGLKVRPFAPEPGTTFGQKTRQALLLDGEDYTRSVVFTDNDEGTINMVANTRGGIGIIHAENIHHPLIKKVRIVPVRFLSIVVNEKVLSIQNNVRLNSFTEDDVSNIFLSKVRNWKDIGGIDLPVTVISYNKDSYPGQQFQELVLGNRNPGIKAVFMDNIGQIGKAINNNEGAVAYCLFSDIHRDFPGKIAMVERREITPNISAHFLLEKPEKAGKAGGIFDIIINTLLMIIFTILLATPVGVGAAIYLTEYARQGKFIDVLRFFTETLAAVPSIIFGLFGYILFVNFFGWGMGLLSGTLTVTIMILPTIIRTAEEAFKAVPREYREESLALGATHWQTIKGVVIPSAIPGILTGIILGIGRAVGETAAVLFTLGSSPTLARDIFSSARVLSLHLYILAKEGISFERAFSTAFILVVIILVVNVSASSFAGKMNTLKKKS